MRTPTTLPLLGESNHLCSPVQAFNVRTTAGAEWAKRTARSPFDTLERVPWQGVVMGIVLFWMFLFWSGLFFRIVD